MISPLQKVFLYKLTSTKRNKKKTSLLEFAKKLNIHRRNCMKTKEELKKAIKDTITKYKDIVFGPIYMACLDELRRQPVIDKKEYDQRLMDDTVRKLA